MAVPLGMAVITLALELGACRRFSDPLAVFTYAVCPLAGVGVAVGYAGVEASCCSTDRYLVIT